MKVMTNVEECREEASNRELAGANYRILLLMLWRHIKPKRRIQIGLLVMVMLLSSLAELLTVASMVPFLAVISNPSALWNHSWVQRSGEAMGFTNPQQLILPLTLLLMAAGVASALIRASNLFVNGRLSAMIGSDLAIEGFSRTLEQPYEIHLERNSSDVMTGLSYLGGISLGILTPLLQALSGLIVAMVLVIGLLTYQPILAIVLSAIFLGTYAVIARVTRQRMRRVSVLTDLYSKCSLKAQQEGLGAIRDVLLDGSQRLFVDMYRNAQRPLMLLQSEAEYTAGLPRFAMEAAGVAGIAGSVFLLWPRGGMREALPAVGAIALGFQKLLPAIQQVYAASAYLGAYRDVLAGGLKLLEQREFKAEYRGRTSHDGETQSLPYEKSFEMQEVGFCHRDGNVALRDINLTIRPGEWIGLVGPTGSGKSTLVDLLLGLLSPSIGKIYVDGTPLEAKGCSIDRRKAWQRHVAHVPQTIFLADTSIAENIAFGIHPENIDHERVMWAAKCAQVEDFITTLSQGINTPVGERGVRLSGGQRQRIGIARALYKKADILVLDEATSALDTLTEQRVMDAIFGLKTEYTVIIVAHRLSTVTECNRIIELKDGRIQAQGSYNELLSVSPSFRQMSNASQV